MRKFAVGCIVSLLLLAGCGGGTSPSPINQPTSSGSNPTPTITTISPNSTVAGSTAFGLTINGTNFVAASVVNFGGSALATTFLSSTQLLAAITAASVASTGTLAVTVTNPGTNISQTTTSNGGGDYEFPNLRVGTYNVAATATNYAKSQAQNISISVGNRQRC